MKIKVFFVLIFVQILTIVFLFFQIKRKNGTTLGISVNPIDSTTIQRTQIGSLHYFYEPKANTTQEVHKIWLPYVPKYTINSDTLNERYDYHVKKDLGVFRIITLGDSFTFGENVDTKNNYSEQLEDLLNARCLKNRYEVINLGVPGYDIQYMNERYKQRGAKYKPDLVIMLFGDFQLFRINEELIKTEKDITKSNPNLDSLSITIKASKDLISNLGWDSILEWQRSQIKSLINSIDSKELIVKFPFQCNNDKYNWYTQTFECWPFIAYNNIFKEIVGNSSKNKSISFLNDFVWKKNYSLPDGHPSVEGHKAIAADVFQYLTKNKLIPCSP